MLPSKWLFTCISVAPVGEPEGLGYATHLKTVHCFELCGTTMLLWKTVCPASLTMALTTGLSMCLRHQVDQLVSFCEYFEREKFAVDETNCFIILEQCHNFLETPPSVQAKCESAVRQRVFDLSNNALLMVSFKALSFMAIKGVLSTALPEMFSLGNFPKPYIKLGEALIAWLNTNPALRGEFAVELFSLLEFEAFGLDGIAQIVYPEKEWETDENWVRSHPIIENQVLDSLRLAGKQPYHFTRSQEWRPPCDGRYTIVCSGSNSRRGTNIGTVIATFDLLAADALVLNCSENSGNIGCSVCLKCGPSKKSHHVLLAIGANSIRYYDEHVYGYDISMEDPVHESLLGTTLSREGGTHQCKCRFESRGTAKEVRQKLSADGPLRYWVSPDALEQFESHKMSIGSKVTILCRPTGSKRSCAMEMGRTHNEAFSR